ncbi:MAG: hypothetical protein SVX43_18260, partial [Cyanobacteriota bacterium]|nr:hypothetical protein [Cyanobacteriota bacterium]
TTPGRAEELTKRAIRAIMRHNAEIATENNQRWAITQSIIAALIGGRPSSIGKAMKPYQTQIDDHNAKYGINGYTNRSQERKIDEAIDLAELVPDGLESTRDRTMSVVSRRT